MPCQNLCGIELMQAIQVRLHSSIAPTYNNNISVFVTGRFYFVYRYTPNANIAVHSVSARDEFYESGATWASVFCFDNASPEKSCFVDNRVCFMSLCPRLSVFLMLPEGRNVCLFFLLFFQFSCSKTNEGKEFTIAEGTAKICSLHFRLQDLGKCVTNLI